MALISFLFVALVAAITVVPATSEPTFGKPVTRIIHHVAEPVHYIEPVHHHHVEPVHYVHSRHLHVHEPVITHSHTHHDDVVVDSHHHHDHVDHLDLHDLHHYHHH